MGSLDDAVGHLETTLAHVDDEATADRVTDLIEQLERLQARSRGPDAGRLGRLSYSLREVRDDLESTEASVAVERAQLSLRSYEPDADEV